MIDEKLCCTAPFTRADRRRRKITDAARKLFIENGFHATGIAQIAGQSGVAVGQIYRDYSSKEEIVSALVREDCGTFMDAARLKVAMAAGDSGQVLAWLHHFVDPERDEQGDRLLAEIVAEAARNERIARIFVTLQDELRGHLFDALAMLSPDESREPERAVLIDMIMTFSLGLLHHRLFRPTLDAAPVVRALQRIISAEIAELTGA